MKPTTIPAVREEPSANHGNNPASPARFLDSFSSSATAVVFSLRVAGCVCARVVSVSALAAAVALSVAVC